MAIIRSLRQKLALSTVSAALCSTEFYPVNIDATQRLISFVRLTRDAYRQAAFLGPQATGQLMYTFNLDDLLTYDAQVAARPARAHYILISGFCCSTLLARYLDMIPHCFVLKEPYILGQLALLRRRMPEARDDGTACNDREEDWQNLASLCLRLLTRTFSKEDTVVIKAPDICNHLGDILLLRDARTKLLLLSVNLRTFILSVLKSQPRRLWLRDRMKTWKPEAAEFPALRKIDTEALDDAKAGAYVWLVSDALWRDLLSKADSRRIFLLDGEEVSETPGQALRKVTCFFGLPIEDLKLEEVLESRPMCRHSQNPARQYDAASRRNDMAAAEKRFGAEADRAIEWASKIQYELGLPSDQSSGLSTDERQRPTL